MKEYIERDEAIAVIEELQKECCPVGMFSRNATYGTDRERFDALEKVIDKMDSIPAADVVEVVRCRDCAKREICRTSNTWAVAPSDDWFCADGERKGGENDHH